MRTRDSVRRTIAGLALALTTVACSIEAPKIEIVAGDGGEPVGSIQTGSEGRPGFPAGPGAAPTVGGAGTVSGGAGGASAGGSQAGSDCAGKSTDVGVTGSTIRLGSTFGVSGPVSNISGPILKGVQAYFNEVNSKGGIYGRKIDFKWYDDGWDAQRGLGYIKRLVEQDKVFVMSVSPSSNGLDAAQSYLEQKQVPVYGTSGLIESQFRSPMQWPVGASTKSAARIGLTYWKSLGARSVAYIWLDLLAGREAYEAAINATPKIFGKKVEDVFVNIQGYRVSISEADFGPVWARIIQDTKTWQKNHGLPVDGRPDAVAFAIDPTNAIKALQAAENIGFRPRVVWGGAAPLFLDLVWQGSDYAAKTGLLAGTSYFPPIGDYLRRPAVQDYVRTVRKYYGTDVDLNNPYLEGGYAGAALTVEILRRAGPCLTRASTIRVANAVTNFSAAGLTPPLTYQPFGRGQSHYGNIFGLVAKVAPDNRWVVAHDFIADPTPGAT